MDIRNKQIKYLEEAAQQIRALTIKAIYEVRSGHAGPSLSIIDIITSLLFNEMNWKKFLEEIRGKSDGEQWQHWHNPELKRDRFILSKGHGIPAWYAALAVGGYINEKELSNLRNMGSRLQGHPERKYFPFIDSTTGSLGQGQSVALGYALAAKLNKRKEHIYCIIGDGEINEGQIWEAILCASKYRLDNLIVIVDFNKRQGEGNSKRIMNLEPLDDKWLAFNWHVQRINGHDIRALLNAFQKAYKVKGRPHVIIADTRKGYLGGGQVFMKGAHNPSIDEANYNRAITVCYKNR